MKRTQFEIKKSVSLPPELAALWAEAKATYERAFGRPMTFQRMAETAVRKELTTLLRMAKQVEKRK